MWLLRMSNRRNTRFARPRWSRGARANTSGRLSRDRDAGPFSPSELQYVDAVGNLAVGAQDFAVTTDGPLVERASRGALRVDESGLHQGVDPRDAGVERVLGHLRRLLVI